MDCGCLIMATHQSLARLPKNYFGCRCLCIFFSQLLLDWASTTKDDRVQSYGVFSVLSVGLKRAIFYYSSTMKMLRSLNPTSGMQLSLVPTATFFCQVPFELVFTNFAVSFNTLLKRIRERSCMCHY